jgi:hypothetical protein
VKKSGVTQPSESTAATPQGEDGSGILGSQQAPFLSGWNIPWMTQCDLFHIAHFSAGYSLPRVATGALQYHYFFQVAALSWQFSASISDSHKEIELKGITVPWAIKQ